MTSPPDDILADWNGDIMPLADIRVSVLDRAFMFGDSVYEVIRIYNGVPFMKEDHMARLSASLEALSIRGVDLEAIDRRLSRLLDRTGLKEASAYIQVTRGVAARSHFYPDKYEPNTLVFVQPFHDRYAEARKNGARVISLDDLRWHRNDIKSTNLVANCMAAQYAKEHDCQEVVFVGHDGYMTEGSSSSLFGIKEGVVIVPPATSNVLPGITKTQILHLAEQIGLEVSYEKLRIEDISALDEFFMAGTAKELIPVVEINGKKIGDGRPGPVVRKLYKAYEAHVQAKTAQTADNY